MTPNQYHQMSVDSLDDHAMEFPERLIPHTFSNVFETRSDVNDCFFCPPLISVIKWAQVMWSHGIGLAAEADNVDAHEFIVEHHLRRIQWKYNNEFIVEHHLKRIQRKYSN